MNSRSRNSASFKSLKRTQLCKSIIIKESARVKIRSSSVISVIVLILNSVIRLERYAILTVKVVASRSHGPKRFW